MTTVKTAIWFAATLCFILSFPAQVYLGNPYPSLIPYCLIGVVMLLTFFAAHRGVDGGVRSGQYHTINLIVGVYVGLVLLDTVWQVGFGLIAAGAAATSLFVYLCPVLFYLYFRRLAAEQEVHAVLLAMAVGGLVVGLYFAYDSYLKLGLGLVSEYSQRAFQYSLDRAVETGDTGNDARIRAGWRSFGLLETHSVSGCWVVLGTLAALALVPPSPRVLRYAVVFVFAVMLLLGLNFTAIVAFTAIIVLFEFGGFSLLRGRLSVRLGVNLLVIALLTAIVMGSAFWVAGDTMSQYIVTFMSDQRNLALGTGNTNKSMASLLLINSRWYIAHILDMPFTLLVGDGFSFFGMIKGGDIGFIESLASLGLPMFSVVLFGFVRLIRAAVLYLWANMDGGRMDDTRRSRRHMLQFAGSVLLLILITEGHYSVWASKSVLPVVFFSLALFARYLPASGTHHPHRSVVSVDS